MNSCTTSIASTEGAAERIEREGEGEGRPREPGNRIT